MVALLVVAALLVAALLRAPAWLLAALMVVALSLTVAVVWLGDLERGLTPLLLTLLGVGLLVPPAVQATRSARVAPAKRKGRRAPERAKGSVKASSFDVSGIPGYELLEKVGSGGMASVFRARRLSDGSIVALKIPVEQFVADAKFIRRFHREAEVAQRLNHRNIVRTYEHGSSGVQHYMVMEFVDGRSLESYIEGGELEMELSVEIMKHVVEALQHIHSAGIIHRDIKPANVMITRGGIGPSEGGVRRLKSDAVKLMDFGIAGGKVMSRLTMTGARVGTPVYMSPEQARGLRIDHRSDIYSLGLVFYEMLTGQTAFKGGYEAIVHQQIFQTPAPPRQVELSLPRSIDQLVMRMIAKEPDERPSLEEVLETLERVDFEAEEEADLPVRIVLTVSARQGVIRVLDPEGNLHGSMGDVGVGAGKFSAAPLSVAIDSRGDIFAAIFEYRVGEQDHRMIHKLSPGGEPKMSFGSYGMQPGEFLYPVSLVVAPDDSVYVLDGETHMVSRFTNDGRYLMSFGGRGGGHGEFNDPRSLMVDGRGRVYVLDHGNRQVQRLGGGGEYETRWAFKVAADDPSLRRLDGMTVDSAGSVYISDANASKVRKITPDGKVGVSFSLEALHGEASEALVDLGVDDAGYLYAARRGGHLVRKFDPAGRLIKTFETYSPLVQMLVDVREGVEARAT